MAFAIPKRRSSQSFSMYQPSPPLAAPSFSRANKHERIVPMRGESTSPIRRSDRLDIRKAPSRTFVPPNVPSDILDFPKVQHPRIDVDITLSSPVFVGGATIEGDVNIRIDGGQDSNRKTSRPTLSISRIVISLIGIERSNGRRSIFRSLATVLVDETHPPPIEMVPTGRLPAEGCWEVLPSASDLAFRLDLPVAMGPPPYAAKRQGILYLLTTTIEAKVGMKQEFARRSREVTVFTVHDPEKALVNLPSPLSASEELRFSNRDGSQPIEITAGLHRQTWISGYMLFVDIHIKNGSNKSVTKIEVQLERVILSYSFPAVSTETGPADSLRVPDHCEKAIVARSTMRGPRDAVPPHSDVFRTCRLEVPTGLVSVDTGRFFGVRFFLKVRITCSFAKHATVQLPISIIHPNSVDVPPNSLAQVATAIEYKHRDHLLINGSTYQYTPGRAFTAARERSLDKLRATSLSPHEIRDLTIRLDGSPRKMKHQRSRVGTNLQNPPGHGNTKSRHGSLRPRVSLDSYGPRLQRSTSGLAFDKSSDKENTQDELFTTPITLTTNRSPFARSVLRELDVRAIRNSTLAGLINNATKSAKKQGRIS